MKKILKPLLIALSTTTLLHLISILVIYSIGRLDKVEIQDTVRNLPLSFSLFFIPLFLSLLLFDKNKNKAINIFKPALISMILLSLFEIIFSEFFRNRSNFSYFDGANFRVSIIGFFVSFFITVVQILAYGTLNKKIKNYENIKFPWRIIFLIPFVASSLYSLIIVIAASALSNLVPIWFSSFPLGIILTIISFHFFKKLNNKNRKLKIVSFYILSIIIFVVFWILSYLIYYPFTSSIKNILFELVDASIVLFSPYFLFIITTTHLNFLRIINKEEKLQLTQQSLESQLNYQQLKNQLSPHFLFNNINVLTSLIEENPTKAVRFSENLSHIYRYFLEQEKQDVVLVKDEIEFARSYLELLQDRFEVGLNFIIIIDEKVGEKHIVSTILQQVLENVVKHNTINEINIIDVKITSEENYLIIENNKNPKLKTTSESKKGIENIKKRIAFFTDEKVIIEDAETYFIIKLPILETV
jgi:two-component system LytT family sensor kinase